MILTKSFLENQAKNRGIYYTDMAEYRSINENNEIIRKSLTNEYDIFLSHSYYDKRLVLTLVDLFHSAGYSVYVDWIEDEQLNRSSVNKSTANILKVRMKNSKGLSYLTTQNSSNSKWCPWELGYFDGLKKSRCCILPVLDYNQDSFHGQEYLGLYPYIDYNTRSDNGEFDFWVYDPNDRRKYVILKSWLSGYDPISHN